MAKRLYPLLMEPVCKDYLWGGTRLVEEYGKKTPLRPVAESWEVSCHPDGPSRIANGELAGKTLAQVLADKPQWLGSKGRDWDEFPILIKLIDAKGNLSLQVHPDDEYARRVEGQYGKNEMWYVMDCREGAELILGFEEPLTQTELENKIKDGTILEAVRRMPVQPGDCFLIPAGMLHAIGEGMLIAEIQQSSNVTYRVYDYGRLGPDGKPRQLHIDRALTVTDTAKKGERSTAPSVEIAPGCAKRVLADWAYFTTWHLDMAGRAEFCCGAESFQCMLLVAGSAVLSWPGGTLKLERGQSVFLPAGLGTYSLEGMGQGLLSWL